MAYTDFTLSDLEEKFGVKNERKKLYFGNQNIEPSQRLLLEP